MCGRYVVTKSPQELAAEFGVDRIAVDEPVEPDYNVAPMKHVPAVLTRESRDKDHPGLERQLRAARWGLVPAWAKDPSVGNRLINARIETAGQKPSFRQAFAKRRAILPADGYYEWQEQPPRDGKKMPKQPFFIHRPDRGALAMAGLYELWRDPAREREDPHAWLLTVTVLTTDATDELGRIHDRAPLIVPAEAYGTWLAPQPGDADELRSLLIPATVCMQADPVSTAVNNVRNQGPELISPLPDDGSHQHGSPDG